MEDNKKMKKKDYLKAFLAGYNHCKKQMHDAESLASEYAITGENEKIRECFMAGFAYAIPQYAKVYTDSYKDVINEIDLESIKSDIGVDNTRNNSYLGGFGTGKQLDENGIYIEEKVEDNNKKLR